VHHLCDCGFLASEYFPTKVLRVNGLDRALKALVEKQPWPSLLRGDCDRQEVAEVIRLVYGEGQRREHLEKAAHIATKAAQLAGDLYDGMAPAQQQPLLPDVRRQALALLQLAVQEEEEAAAASSPPLLTLPPSSPSMVPVALGSWKLLQAIEKQLDDWTVEALAALAMRDPETTQPASLPRLESVQARVNAMVFLRRELCWKEPTHAKLTYLQERLGRARAFSLENCKNMGLSGKVLIETADQGEEVESLRDLIAQIEEMLEDDSPVLQRERAEAKLSHCREMLRRSKLDAGLPLGFVNVWVRDHPEVRALQSQVERLTQAEAGVAQGTVNGNTDRLSAKGSYVQYLAL
jgi:hypothetical protein